MKLTLNQPNSFMITCNILDNIQKQLVSELDYFIGRYGSNFEEEMLFPFNGPNWLQAEPYSKMLFNYEHAKFNFLQICNIYEMFHKEEKDFFEELTSQVKETVTSRLAYWKEIYAQDRQLEWNANLVKEIEEGAAA